LAIVAIILGFNIMLVVIDTIIAIYEVYQMIKKVGGFRQYLSQVRMKVKEKMKEAMP
jgi:hypothetical protein